MTDTTASELLFFAGQIADEGRAIIRDALRAAHEIDIKADQSFVTSTDRAVEQRLRERIEAAYPGHGILGEEFGSRDLDKEFVWVLDPIDGTAPFIAGIPVYGILIGIARAGRPWLGLMDLPATGERLSGVSGSFADYNGQPIRCRPCETLDKAFLTSSNPRFLTAGERVAVDRLDARVAFTQYGGSCYSYGCLARGKTDIAVDGGFDSYDVFAPIAIIEGAGGVASDWSGAPIDVAWKGQIVAAGDQRLHQVALATLAG
ncbi:inositol monophosphatase family protein [Paracoccus denitrificans]|uniref:inositol monophosphatase family protein n=1 Tax=Paracoccus denitrificans TaxID=266 RepID=UPI000CEBF7C4|nr:inositol monophosphatase family protein [Paracoccus denitrificans]